MRSPITRLRSDRHLAAGQRLLKAWRFSEALETLDRGLVTDPSEVGLLLYRGRALAELGRYDEAAVAIEAAIAIEPRNHALPLALGCIQLDAGLLSDSSAAFSKAERLDPGNSLAVALELLVEYRLGRAPALDGLKASVNHLSCDFLARLLTNLPATPISHWFELAEGESDQARGFRKARVLVRPLLEQLSARRIRRMSASAIRLFNRGKYEDAVSVLAFQLAPTELTVDARQCLSKARARAIAELTTQQTGPKGGRAPRRRTLSFVKRQASGGPRASKDRSLIARTMRMRAPSDVAGLRSDCQTWLDSFRQDGEPKRERHDAADIATDLARLSLFNGTAAEATEFCEMARRYRRLPETDWIQAVACITLGEAAAGRRFFERYASVEEIQFRQRVLARLSHLENAGATPART